LKPLRNLLNNLKPNFEKGKTGKNSMHLTRLKPSVCTQSYYKKGTHVRDAIDLKRTMILVVLSLVPCLYLGCEYWLPTPPALGITMFL
jgi:Na+-transporting NADH:ubiquinone oxidoreductase subunit B